LKDQLYHFVNALQDHWDIYLPVVGFMYNTTVSLATNYTPYYLMFGREMKMPAMECLLGKIGNTHKLKSKEREEYIQGLVRALGVAWNSVTTRGEKNASRYNIPRRKPIKFVEYKVGDQVMMVRQAQYQFESADEERAYKITSTLQARYEGPYKIIEKKSPVLYRLQIGERRPIISAVNLVPV